MDQNAIAILDAEHQNIRQLFNRVSSPAEDRSEVLDTLMESLASHVAIEQHVLVATLENHVDDSKDMVEALKHDHGTVEHLLTLLERRKANSPDVPDLVNELLDRMQGHFTEAQDRLFPALRRSLSEAELRKLGEEIVSDEGRSLARRHAPISARGPVAGIAGKASQIIDRIRDRHRDDLGTQD